MTPIPPIPQIPRYKLVGVGFADHGRIEQGEGGEYVRYSDHVAEVERLNRELEGPRIHRLRNEALEADAHNLKSSVHAICNQNLTETLTAALEEKQRADALERENTRLKTEGVLALECLARIATAEQIRR